MQYLYKSHNAFLILILIFLSINTSAQNNTDSINKNSLQTIESFEEPIHIGVVLSGGGAKGLAHIGVLKVLEQEGIYVDYIAGTSMGGLVGGLYASGYSPQELDSITNSMPWDKLMSDKPERGDLPLDEKKSMDEYIMRFPVKGFVPGLPKGLRTGQLVLNYINKLVWNVADVKDFSKLPIPFFCVATKLENGDTMVLKNGNLATALRATMSIPTVFEPVKFNDVVLIDGMMVNNFPVDVMKMNKDIDFVIGVDVGSPLLNVNEITSIISILEQTSSYHAYGRFLKNVELTDLYLKPKVEDISVLDFSDVTKIIERGEQIALDNIEIIRALAKKARDNKKKYRKIRDTELSEMIYLSEIDITGLKKIPRNMVLGRLGLNLPGVNNIKNINSAIDRLYSSNFFKSINYRFEKQMDSYILHISVVEKSENLFEIGANYNSDFGAGLKINFLLHNIIAKGSKTNISLKVGNNPSGSISFLSERGKRIGVGINTGYKTRSFLEYASDYQQIISRYHAHMVSIGGFGNINYSNNAVFQVGLSFDFFDILPEVTPIPINDLGIFYSNVFVKFKSDSYDNKYFPTKGSYFHIYSDLINFGRPETGFFAKMKMSTIFKLTPKLSFTPQLFIGGLWSSSGGQEYAYYYVVGGSNDTSFNNSVYMPGLPYSAIITNNTAISYYDFRYKFWKDHYFYLRTAMGVSSTYFEELLTNSTFILSGSVGYTYKSPIGPLGLQLGTSNLSKDLSLYIFLGMDI